MSIAETGEAHIAGADEANGDEPVLLTAPEGGVPKPGPLTVHLRDNHLQYALTWFGLAAVVTAAFGFWLVGARRRRPASCSRHAGVAL